MTKKQLTLSKIEEINKKNWFQILKSQYISLFREKDKIKTPEKLDMETEYPLLLDFTKKILSKLREKFP